MPGSTEGNPLFLPLIISLVPRVSPEPRGLLGPVSPKAKEKEGWTVLGNLSPHTT